MREGLRSQYKSHQYPQKQRKMMRLQIVLSLQAAALPATKDLNEWMPLNAIMPKSRVSLGKGLIWSFSNPFEITRYLEVEKLALMIEYLLADEVKQKFK